MPRNWDEHYRDSANLDFTPSPLLVEIADRLAPGKALDLACGAGRNAVYLASLGWQVTAVDSSAVAIRHLRERSAGLRIDARLANLESGEFQIPPDTYQLICDVLYLQRDLFPGIRNAIVPGGLFVGEIHLADPEPSPFRLQPGELRTQFAGWKILYYSEGSEPGGRRRAARIVARRA